MKQKKIKLSKAVFLIILSTIIFSSINIYFYINYRKFQKKRLFDPKYDIMSILHSTKDDLRLDTPYLAEVLTLSSNNPKNLFLYPVEVAQNLLNEEPIIKNAKIKKIKNNTLKIDYEIKNPIAFLYDFENIAFDEDYNIFFVSPYIEANNLIDVYINIENSELDLKKPLIDKRLKLANSFITEIKKSGFLDLVKINLIDVSRSYHESYGKREIVLTILEEMQIEINSKNVKLIFPRYLRLPIKNYLQQLSNYLSLRKKMQIDYLHQLKDIEDIKNEIIFKPKTIDLRIQKLAFIDEKG
ncbi:MAG: hypothetical protein K1060chlam5_00554 [Candidatus Anoxychlamydiales bacterium]|nr:hypothetical protein [Candidatus Anoxychlamydiales bacterium]